jgi:hypothetical protein
MPVGLAAHLLTDAATSVGAQTPRRSYQCQAAPIALPGYGQGGALAQVLPPFRSAHSRAALSGRRLRIAALPLLPIW